MTPLLEPSPLKAGDIVLANENRFNAAHLSEPLTAYSAGWKDPENLQDLLDFLAPPVPVARRFEFRRADNSQAFLSETDDIRATGSGFKRVEYSGETIQSKTFNKGLTIRVDHDEAVGDDWQERYTQILIQRLLRNELRRAISALDGADTNDNKVWNSTANPDGDLRTALAAGTTTTGIRPNRIVFGETAWDIRSDAYDAQNNAGAFRQSVLGPKELASRLFVDDIRILHARYQATETAKATVLGGAVYCFYGLDGLLKDEPSSLKRFITPTDGSPFRVYVETSAKYTDISVEHYSNLVVTSTLGIRKLTISAS